MSSHLAKSLKYGERTQAGRLVFANWWGKTEAWKSSHITSSRSQVTTTKVQHVKRHEVRHITGKHPYHSNILEYQNATPSVNTAIRPNFPTCFSAEVQGSTYKVSQTKRSPVHCSMDPIEQPNSDHVAVQLQGGEPCWRFGGHKLSQKCWSESIILIHTFWAGTSAGLPCVSLYAT